MKFLERSKKLAADCRWQLATGSLQLVTDKPIYAGMFKSNQKSV